MHFHVGKVSPEESVLELLSNELIDFFESESKVTDNANVTSNSSDEDIQ